MSAPKVSIERPARRDASTFIAAVAASRSLHAGFVKPPTTAPAYREMLAADRRNDNQRYLVWTPERELVGMFNVSGIIRGAFKSGYLGYYAFAQHAGTGRMSAGLSLVLTDVFGPLRLHRVEANIQPENMRSIAFVRRFGFREEGYSPRYLKIGGQWRDHVRFALLAEEWREARRARRRG